MQLRTNAFVSASRDGQINSSRNIDRIPSCPCDQCTRNKQWWAASTTVRELHRAPTDDCLWRRVRFYLPCNFQVGIPCVPTVPGTVLWCLATWSSPVVRKAQFLSEVDGSRRDLLLVGYYSCHAVIESWCRAWCCICRQRVRFGKKTETENLPNVELWWFCRGPCTNREVKDRT